MRITLDVPLTVVAAWSLRAAPPEPRTRSRAQVGQDNSH